MNRLNLDVAVDRPAGEDDIPLIALNRNNLEVVGARPAEVAINEVEEEKIREPSEVLPFPKLPYVTPAVAPQAKEVKIRSKSVEVLAPDNKNPLKRTNQ